MEERAALRLLLLLFAVSSRASVQDDVKYVRVGDSLVLTPPPSATIDNILWKHNGDLVAERIKGSGDLIVYGSYKQRTSLERATGRLEVKNANSSDSGVYSVEINDQVLTYEQRVNVIHEVPTPMVRVTPLTCGAVGGSCNVTCTGDTGPAEPVTFHWKEEGKDWETSKRFRPFTAADTKHVKWFMCRMENPVSKKDSEPRPNPLYEADQPDLTALWVILGLIVAFGVAGLGYWKRNVICGPRRTGEHSVTADASAPDAPAPENEVPLKEAVDGNSPP